MSSKSSSPSINIIVSTNSSAETPVLPTPTPEIEPTYKWGEYHTGYTPESKKTKRSLFTSPDTKRKIDEIHHYQRQQIELQRELYFEQKATSTRLSTLQKMISKLCRSNEKDVVSPLPSPTNPIDPSAAYRTEDDPVNYAKEKYYTFSPQHPPYSPNSWDKNYNKNEGPSYSTPKTTPPSK